MRSVTLFVPVMPPSTNSIYSGCHWTKRKREADKMHQYVARIASEMALKPFSRPVRISMTPSLGKGARSRDCTNWAYSFKLLEDGLVRSGLIAGDEADKVIGITINANTVDRKSESGLWVTITEVEAA